LEVEGVLNMWRNLNVAGRTGSEGGIIFFDEEYKDACRITLEKCDRYYAITCGVYGAMVHTAFTDFEHYTEMYHAMKNDLQAFIDKETPEDEECEFYKEFTEKYQ
jgi:hypothetical protein